MKEYTIYAGDRLNGFVDDQHSVSFDCEPDDIDTAYAEVSESAVLKDQSEYGQDFNDFANCQDDDVETMLKDLMRMHFLSDYEISDVDE